METAKKKKKRDPRIGQPGSCAICRTYTGKKLTLSKFFRCGPVPPWAVVHPGCNRREKPAQFRERLHRWLAERTGQAVPAATVAVDAAGVIGSSSGASSGSTPQTAETGRGCAGYLGPFSRL